MALSKGVVYGSLASIGVGLAGYALIFGVAVFKEYVERPLSQKIAPVLSEVGELEGEYSDLVSRLDDLTDRGNLRGRVAGASLVEETVALSKEIEEKSKELDAFYSSPRMIDARLTLEELAKAPDYELGVLGIGGAMLILGALGANACYVKGGSSPQKDSTEDEFTDPRV